MDFFPIFMNLAGRDCLVAGGGRVAARKTTLLVRAKAKVEVVSPQLCDELATLVADGVITHRARHFEDRLPRQTSRT